MAIMKRKSLSLVLLAAFVMALLCGCNELAQWPPEDLQEVTGQAVQRTEENAQNTAVSFFYDNTHDTYGFISVGSKYLESMRLLAHQIGQWDKNAKTFCLDSSMKWGDWKDAVKSFQAEKVWKTEDGDPPTFDQAFPVRAFYYGIVTKANNQGPLQRLLAYENHFDATKLNVYTSDLMEQGGQVDKFASDLVEKVLHGNKKIGLSIFRIDSAYSGSKNVPDYDQPTQPWVTVEVTSAPFFVIMLGPASQTAAFANEFEKNLTRESIPFVRQNVMPSGGVTAIAAEDITASVKSDGPNAPNGSASAYNDLQHLIKATPNDMFVNPKATGVPANYYFTADSSNYDDATVSFYLPLDSLPQQFSYALEDWENKGEADYILNAGGADVYVDKAVKALILPENSSSAQEDEAEEATTAETKAPKLSWNGRVSEKGYSGYLKVQAFLRDKDVPQTEGSEAAKKFAYQLVNGKSVLQVKLDLKNIKELKKDVPGGELGAALLYIRIPVTARVNAETLFGGGEEFFGAERIYKDFFRVITGQTEGPLKAEWEQFRTSELCAITICIRL